MAYCERSDIEAQFGVANVETWADLEALGDDADERDIEARITAAIAYADAIIDARLRASAYAIPLADPNENTPTLIRMISAILAGVWLYESRGVQDVDAATNLPIHRLAWHKQKAEADLREIANRTLIIDAVLNYEPVPKVVETIEGSYSA